jgi:hypothetical protein
LIISVNLKKETKNVILFFWWVTLEK